MSQQFTLFFGFGGQKPEPLVVTHGPLPNHQEGDWNLTTLRNLAHDTTMGRVRTQLTTAIEAPSGPQGEGFMHIDGSNFRNVVRAEGVKLIQQGTAAVLLVPGDDPVLVLYEMETRQLMIVHAGRAALTPTLNGDGEVENIVTKAYRRLTKGIERPNVMAYITGSISPVHYPHDQPEDRLLIAPFRTHFGDVAIADGERGTLDMMAVIMSLLEKCGVRIIHRNSRCSYCTPWMASERRDGKGERNIIIATLL